MRNPFYRFETAQLVVRAEIEPDYDLDLSWDEGGETAAKLDSGEYVAFSTLVTVEHKASGAVLATESLCGSIYADPAEFFTAHRNSPDEYRNTLANKARGVVICHYFPDMVATACAAARKALASMPRVRSAA